GLGARQIAAAFLSDERTVAQRIVRAKQRLREESAPFAVPEDVAMPVCLSAVLDVLYVVFSEGFNPTRDETGADADLCRDALRLVRLLTERRKTAVPSAFALRALLAFHASRLPARVGQDGGLLLMPEQDRLRWDAALVAEGFRALGSAGSGDDLSRFHVE